MSESLTKTFLSLLLLSTLCLQQCQSDAPKPAADLNTEQPVAAVTQPEWVSRAINILKARVMRAERDLQALTDQPPPPIYAYEPRSWYSLDSWAIRLLRLSQQAMRAEADRVIKQLLYEEAKAGRITELPEAFDNPDLATSERLEDRLKSDYERAVREEQDLREAIDRAKAGSKKRGSRDDEYIILKQNVEMARIIYSDFLMKVHRAGIELKDQSYKQESQESSKRRWQSI